MDRLTERARNDSLPVLSAHSFASKSENDSLTLYKVMKNGHNNMYE